jgi:hypothetical protein
MILDFDGGGDVKEEWWVESWRVADITGAASKDAPRHQRLQLISRCKSVLLDTLRGLNSISYQCRVRSLLMFQESQCQP